MMGRQCSKRRDESERRVQFPPPPLFSIHASTNDRPRLDASNPPYSKGGYVISEFPRFAAGCGRVRLLTVASRYQKRYPPTARRSRSGRRGDCLAAPLRSRPRRHPGDGRGRGSRRLSHITNALPHAWRDAKPNRPRPAAVGFTVAAVPPNLLIVKHSELDRRGGSANAIPPSRHHNCMLSIRYCAEAGA
jgi:hypothetical protein